MTTQSAAAGRAVSAGTLLGGRVAYGQYQDGYRTGIEPVLLAASVPARPGERVVEAGTGAGAGLLCLATRVAGLQGTGLEIDPALAGLAAANFAASGQAGLLACCQDVACWTPDGPYDHAFANPPWHRAQATASPLPGRRLAKQAPDGLLQVWVCALALGLRRLGTLSLVLPSALAGQGMAALQAANCHQISLIPLWPKEGQPARLLILRGVSQGAGDCALLPGLVLHGADGAYTGQAQAILRDGQALAAP